MSNEQSLATIDQSPSFRVSMPVMSADQFMQVIDGRSQFIKKILKADIDFMVLPGTDKKILTKPGAEKLCEAFGLSANYQILDREIDHDRIVTDVMRKWKETKQRYTRDEQENLKRTQPEKFRSRSFPNGWEFQELTEEHIESRGLYKYSVCCTLSSSVGLNVGQGLGTCSTMESKYIRAPKEADNTALQMACKRGLVKAVTSALCLSEYEVEDNVPEGSAPAAAGQSGVPADKVPGPGVPKECPIFCDIQLPTGNWKAPSNLQWTKPPTDTQVGMVSSKKDLFAEALRPFIDDAVLEGFQVPANLHNSQAACSIVISFIVAVLAREQSRVLFIEELDNRSKGVVK